MNIQRPGIQQLKRPFDAIIIGGGINGSGIARDAAERGLNVLLVEKNDFGAGTTAYSSRLIHGGLRYLEQFELGLVFESLQERKRLLANAPHLVRPMAFGVPVYQGAKRGYFLIELGMMLYGLLSFGKGKNMPGHKMYRTERFLKHFPGIEQKGLKGGTIYYDAQATLPERICVENAIAAQEAAREGQRVVLLNHASVEEIVRENKQAVGVKVKDLLTGESFIAKSNLIINATGSQVDSVLKLTGKDHKKQMGGTKGTHIVVDKFPGGPEKTLYIEAQADGRPLFVIPWMDKYLIGTTDIHYKGDLDNVTPSEEEIGYLLKEANWILPSANLQRDDVLYAYAGVRPLPTAEGKKPGEITRKHIIYDHAQEGVSGLVSIVGGKITTFRNLAEQTVDYILGKLPEKEKKHVRIHMSTTRHMPLPGGKGVGNIHAYKKQYVEPAVKQYGVPAETVSHLIDLYGSRYDAVLKLTEENPDWRKPLAEGLNDIGAQAIYAVRNEFAQTTADVLMRRTGTLFDKNTGVNAAETTARLLGKELGWSDAQVQSDVSAYLATVQHFYWSKALPQAKPGQPTLA